MKALLVSAALDHRRQPHRPLLLRGRPLRYAGHTIHDHHGYGMLSLPEVLQVSSNVGATKIGERLGAKTYYQALRAFGIGSVTGVDLAGEQAGILRPLSAWKPIDLATASFGQGLAVTPTPARRCLRRHRQRGHSHAAVHREADRRRQRRSRSREPAYRRASRGQRSDGPSDDADSRGSRRAQGHGAACSVPGLKIAGKTGTAQKVDFVHGGYSRGRIASFVGYFPADDPQLVMLVILDEPQTTIWGGTAAAPVFRSIALAAAERLSISVDPPAEDEQGTAPPASSSPATMANAPASFLGLSLREAIDRARALGVAVDVVGSGYVVRQDPPPSAPLAADQPIRLQLATTGGPLG